MSERIVPGKGEQNVLKEKLLALCPEIFQDGKLNVEALQTLLPDELEDEEQQREHFGLNWPGKTRARQLALQKPVGGTLKPCPGEGVNEEETQNVFIEGDNLEVLKLLREAYSDQVKMIYIDPPYNTGNDFVYKDSFEDSVEDYLAKTGQKDGKTLLVANPKAAGRFHSNWLNFIYPRLRLAREIMAVSGLIVVSIDDNEASNLKTVLDEIFGEENFIANMIWQSRTSISNDQEISLNHNHTFIYCKSREHLVFNGEALNIKEYANPDKDERGPWKLVPIDANKEGGDTKYPIVNPNTGVTYYPPNNRSWSINSLDYQKLYDDGRIMFGTKGTSAPKRKMFLRERIAKGDTKTPSSILLDAGTTKDGTNEVIELFGGKQYFSYPKPVSLIKRLVQYGTRPDSRDLVVDFFAGSGTTGHAVLELNKEDGGDRRFICVQLPEANEPGGAAVVAGYQTLADVSQDRIRRVITRIQQSKPGLLAEAEAAEAAQATTAEDVTRETDKLKRANLFDEAKLPKGLQKLIDRVAELMAQAEQYRQTVANIEAMDAGFRVYKLDSSNLTTTKPYTGTDVGQLTLGFQQATDKPLVEGWTKANLTTEIMLLEGFPLHSRQEPQAQLTENEVVAITSDFNANTLYVCLDAQIQDDTVEALALGREDMLVCLDAALTDLQKVRLDDKLTLKTL